jgi:iron complex outermembrane recepter protein
VLWGTPAPGVPACGGSDTSRGGRFFVYGNSGTLLNDTVDPKTGVFRPFTERDPYNYAPVNYYQAPNERWTGGAFVNYEFGRHADVYGG